VRRHRCAGFIFEPVSRPRLAFLRGTPLFVASVLSLSSLSPPSQGNLGSAHSAALDARCSLLAACSAARRPPPRAGGGGGGDGAACFSSFACRRPACWLAFLRPVYVPTYKKTNKNKRLMLMHLSSLKNRKKRRIQCITYSNTVYCNVSYIHHTGSTYRQPRADADARRDHVISRYYASTCNM
jgi:hypothetical protein